MKKKILLYFMLCLFSITLLSACGKDEEAESSGKLPKEFTLDSSMIEEGAQIVDGVIFDEVLTVAKVSSLKHDSTGTSLGYTLKEADLEKLILCLQEDNVWGVEISEADYQSAVRSAGSGFMVEFLDSTDQFQNGVARLTCVTGTGKTYMNIVKRGEKAKNYSIALPDKAVSFLNEKSAENYNESSSNPGWFDKAFNKGN